VLIRGPAGIGKTALLEEARRTATEQDVRVLLARGGQLESDFPFGVVRQLFESALRDATEPERRQLLAGAAALAAPVVAGAAVLEASGENRSFAVVHGLYWLTANVAERTPVLIAVDDVHWADAPSLRFLHYLARRLSGLSVALVVCSRPGEPMREPTVLAQLAAEPLAKLVQPAALSEPAVAELIRARTGVDPDGEFVTACVAATGGIPFLIGELLAALAADGIEPLAASAGRVSELGPGTVAHATLLRVARLPPAAGALARAVAILGSAAEPQRAAALAGLERREALDAADALAASNILSPGTPLRFMHPIVRAAVYDDLPQGERAAAHERAAGLLTAEGADLDAIAGHLLLSAPAARVEVVDQLRTAARHAIAHGAPENAAAYLRRALEEGLARELRAHLLRELALAERMMRLPGSIDHLRQVQQTTGDAVLSAEAGAELAESLLYLGQWESAIEIIDTALDGLGGKDRELMLRLQGFATAFASFDPRLAHDVERRRRVLREAVRDGTPAARGPALLLASTDTLRIRDLENVLGLVEQGLDGGRLIAEDSDSLWIPQAFAALIFNDELERATQLFDELWRAARTGGSLAGYLVAISQRALIHARRGDVASVEADLRAAFELVAEHELTFALPSLVSFGVEAMVERPELADLAELACAMELPPDFARTWGGAMLREATGRLRQAAGDPQAAIEDFRAAGAIYEALGFLNPNAVGWRTSLALALPGEQRHEALSLARTELADARRAGVPRGIGAALRAVGVLEGGEQGLSALREAVAVLESSPGRLEFTRALVELGAALRRANQRALARRTLADALETARACGATRLAERAAVELRATGARPRREHRSGVDALTPSELRVAQMAADGLSNPEIGQALFVTRNTVETHLRHIYRKLDIRSRDDLSTALEQRAAVA
jgi:DNA-binding CsgD family transcriptional regulator